LLLPAPRERHPHAGDHRRRPHKASHTVVTLDEHGRLLDQQRIAATLDGYEQLCQWARRWPQRCWAVEGAHGVGRALAQRLVGDREPVVDVPAKLAARVRVLSVGHGRKSDPHDAVSVAVAARNAPTLRQVGGRTWRWCCTC
jgi:transposase